MSHGHTRIASKGACIYCGKKDVPLTDEHLVPFSLGGQHILEDASCHACADLTKRFEQDVAREMWGDARTSYNAPSRRKKQRKTHIVLTDPDNPSRRVKIPYSEYPAAMIFYKMSRAGLLEGMPDSVDLSAAWQFTAIHDDVKAKEFEKRFGVKLTSKFRHVPDSFARLLAKIAYCHTLCVLDPGDFRPICLPYILYPPKRSTTTFNSQNQAPRRRTALLPPNPTASIPKSASSCKHPSPPAPAGPTRATSNISSPGEPPAIDHCGHIDACARVPSMTPSIDHLFDRGFIGFEDNGTLVISPVAHRPSLQRMGIDTEKIMNVGGFTSGQKQFLDFHRNAGLLQSIRA